MIVTAVKGLSYMPSVLSSHGSGLLKLDCQATDTCVIICKSNIKRWLMWGLKFHLFSWRKAFWDAEVH